MIYRHWPPHYDPADDPDLFYYFDAADPATLKGADGVAITDGAEVYEWLNKGTSSAKLVPSSTFARPTWHQHGPGGRPALRFSGANALQLNTSAGLTSLAGLTLAVVASTDVLDQEQALLWINRGDAIVQARVYMLVNSRNSPTPGVLSAGGRRVDSNAFQELISPTPVAAGERFILSASFDYASARLRCYQNGVLYADAPFQTPGLSPSTEPSRILCGSPPPLSGGEPLTGWIEAFVAVRSAPSVDAMVPLHHFLRITKGIG